MENQKPIKGTDYTGIFISFLCHDGKGNYPLLKRSKNCRDEHGCWTFGGGGLKFNETIEDALVREMKEEFGTKPLDIAFVGLEEYLRDLNGKPSHWIGLYYSALVNRDEVVNAEPHMHDELCWATLDTLPNPLAGNFEERLKRFRHKLI